jgi:hypothetical protein
MNKKLFVVLLVASAMLISFSLVLASKNAPIKGIFEKMSLPTLATKQSVTPMPAGHLSEQQTALPLAPSGSFPSMAATSGTPSAPKLPAIARGAYPMSITAAAKPEKVQGYATPHHEIPVSALRQEGGEDCASATAIASLPYSATGYTCDNNDDYDEVCPYSGSTSPDVVYSYTPSTNEAIDIDLYGSSYDTKVYVYDGTCDNAYLVACNDDYYSDYTSAIFGLGLTGGHTYYIVVDGYGGACGDYLLNVSIYVPCDVVCPPGGIVDGEPICYDGYVDNYNGGCNSSPFVFETINCGDTICGTSGVYDAGGYREMDWFRLDLANAATLTWSAVAEFPVALWIIDAGSENCSDYTVLNFNYTYTLCETLSISAVVPAGVYWFIIAPPDWGDYPCGVEYVAWLGCEVATTGACCNDVDPYDCQILTPDDCALLTNHTFRGLGTNCGPPNPCLPAPDNDSCQNAIQLYPPDCPAVQTVYGTTVGSTIDCPDVLVWDAVWYKFDLPYASNNVSINYCPTNSPNVYTRGVVLYDECQPDCPNYILYSGLSWVTCPSGYSDLTVWWNNLPAGTYWLPVFAHDYDDMPMDFAFDICIEEAVPCDVVCPPNGIPEGEPDCYDDYVDTYNGGCNSSPYVFQNVNCGDTICGKSGTYLVGGTSQYRDTDWYRVVLGSPGTLSWKVVAEFPLLIFVINGGSENCSDYTILGSMTAAECDTAFLSFDVPAGVYWLWAGPSVYTGYPCGLEYVGIVGCPAQEGCCQFATYCDMLTEADCNNAGGTWNAPPSTCVGTTCQIPMDTTCHLQRDNGTAASYFGSWNVGDQQAIYYDPGTMCTACGPDVYPFRVAQVSGVFYDFAGVGTVDVIFHLYEAGALCDGPGAEIYSFPATVTSFYPDEAVVPLPEVVCLDAPFFLAVEYNSGTTGSIPCLLMDAQVSDTCVQFNWYDGYSPPWIEWYDFWSPPPPGYLMLRADGVCNSGACAQGVPCDLIQDEGNVAYYFSGLSAGDQLAKYFDPEVYCTPPVYPYHVSDVEILLYDFAGVGSVDLRIGVDMVCHDSCDGPGTQIYLSDPITITDFYPTMAHINLPDVVCVYEPFFIVVQWASGVVGSTPSFLSQPETLPCDTCHAWLWYDGYSPPWWEWSDFWAPPVPGCPIVRVSGYTEDPACAQAPCDTTQETLWGGLSPYYVWRNPSRYGDRYLYERFDLPADHGGRLDQIEVAFYATGATGTPNPDFYVWLADGLYPLDNNPPYQAIGDFHINYSDIVYYPSYTTVQTWDRGIMFDPGESFMIGVGHAYAAGDTLVLLSDDGSLNSERSGEWSYGTGPWGTMLDDWGIGLDYLINAVMCPYAPPESTFTIQCSPANASATPGDPAAVKYSVSVGSVLGYNLPVTLSCTPPAGINVGFVTNPVIPPGASDVTISVDPGTSYGTYTLTFCGTGSDGQGPKCCNVSLLVQPPFDECDVPFYHGSQKGSNFGAVGNDAAPDNFLWYGLTAQLFDGTFIVTTTDDLHMALDVYNCEHVGWLPTVHANSYYDPIYNANICYGNFFTPESVISCEYDSVFFVGIMETCVDFSIKIKVYYNPTTTPIVHMYPSLFEDWDVGDAYNDRGNWDQAHNLIYQYDPVDPNLVFGMMKAPFYDDPMYNMWIVPNPYYVWPGQGFCGSGDGYLLDDLYGLISTPGYGYATWPGGPGTYPATLDTDYSILMTAQPIDLNPGDKHIEVWIDFGRNLGDGLSWAQWWHRVLRYAGFYRGDVNASDTLELPMLDVSDLVYLIDYLFQGGPAPLPYVDQGDVNADGIVDIQDVVYLLNFVFLCEPGGPKDYENCAPIDYLRFIPQKWTRPSLFLNPSWQ